GLALADYAIVLQLDPTNVTALAGQEQALQALRSPRPAPPVPAPRSEPSPKTNGHSTPSPARRTGKKTQRHRALGNGAPPTQEHPVPNSPPTEDTPPTGEPENNGPDTSSSPKTPDTKGKTATEDVPDEKGAEVPPGDSPATYEIAPVDALNPDPSANAPTKEREDVPRTLDPGEARAARQREQAEALERAKVWADMRHREQTQRFTRQKEEAAQPQDARNGLFGSWAVRGFLILVVLGLLGGAAYYFFLSARDFKLTAQGAWEEYSADTAAANRKYAGKFVQVTGKVDVQT